MGRAAPEIDVFEAQAQSGTRLEVSQSCQMAPYNWQYNITYQNESDVYTIFDPRKGTNDLNIYNGEVTQQSLSGIHLASQTAVQHEANSQDVNKEGAYAQYALEYRGGTDGYVAWQSDGKPAWEVYSEDPRSMIGQRQYPKEPMYIILNLGISRNFGTIDWTQIMKGFPFEMSIDWVRVYQDPDDPEADVGCDPKDMPTSDYINKYIEAYTNANFTLWGNSAEEGGYQQYWPRNRLYWKGCSGTKSRLPGDPDRPMVSAPFIPSAAVTAVPGAAGNGN